MPADPRDYKLDLANAPGTPTTPSHAPRPFISVYFACCRVYQRLYRSPDGKSYRGHCPRCAKAVNFVVGPGGTDARRFVVH